MNDIKILYVVAYVAFAFMLLINTVQSNAIKSSGHGENESNNKMLTSSLSLFNDNQPSSEYKQGATMSERHELAEHLRKLLNMFSDDENDERSSEVDSAESYAPEYLVKKSAPKRIFIGKRFPTEYREGDSDGGFDLDSQSDDLSQNEDDSFNVDKKSSRRHLFLGKRSSFKRNGNIHRIFIGKRGEIKRIFIG